MSATTDTILAIDLGRYKSVPCVHARATRRHEFRTLDTTPAEVDKLLARRPGAVVVVEACANAGWTHDRAAAAGHVVKVANTAAEALKYTHLKRKTDRDDAKRLAELEAVGQFPTVAPRTRRPASGGCGSPPGRSWSAGGWPARTGSGRRSPGRGCRPRGGRRRGR